MMAYRHANLRSFVPRQLMLALAAGMIAATPIGGAQGAKDNDYPTVTIGDYIFGCMQTNGQTRDALEKCACSIDVVSSILPYEKYEEAETIMSVRLKGGENTAFLFTPKNQEKINDLKRAQVEGELRCF
jgi:hypothetical protein